MIIDVVQNFKLYQSCSPFLKDAAELIKRPVDSFSEKGKYDVDGENLFYLVHRYKTAPRSEGRLEAHRKYIDIHFIISGRELMFYANTRARRPAVAYREDWEAAMYDLKGDESSIILTPGMFAICFPEDAHLPGRSIDLETDVHKIVVKAAI